MQTSLTIHPLLGVPLVKTGDDLSGMLLESMTSERLELADGDIVVVAQKIVSKSEGRLVALRDVEPGPEAVALAAEINKDPRMVELILRESTAIIRKAPDILIVRNRLGIISANAGIDQSNIDHRDGESALLLPEDPDGSAARLRDSLQQRTGRRLGLIISDSLNRPWRLGTMGQAIGSSGLTVLDDRRGEVDLFGRELQFTIINRADSIAAAAVLVMGESIERVPAAVVRGFAPEDSRQVAQDSLRPAQEDLFL